MIERAIEKIKQEINSQKNNLYVQVIGDYLLKLYVQVIGDYLLKQIEINRDAAKKICSENKSIEKNIKEIEKRARQEAKGNTLLLSDNGIYKIIRDYYKFEAVQDRFIGLELEEIFQEIDGGSNSQTSKREKFNIDINDYI